MKTNIIIDGVELYVEYDYEPASHARHTKYGFDPEIAEGVDVTHAHEVESGKKIEDDRVLNEIAMILFQEREEMNRDYQESIARDIVDSRRGYV